METCWTHDWTDHRFERDWHLMSQPEEETMTIKELREAIRTLPDTAPVMFIDRETGDAYHTAIAWDPEDNGRLEIAAGEIEEG